PDPEVRSESDLNRAGYVLQEKLKSHLPFLRTLNFFTKPTGSDVRSPGQNPQAQTEQLTADEFEKEFRTLFDISSYELVENKVVLDGQTYAYSQCRPNYPPTDLRYFRAGEFFVLS